jgi:AmmeMemoRadiSam system protein A
MFSLDNREKQYLLNVARRALVAAVEGGQAFEVLAVERDEAECAGAFVTLKRRTRLRGCIGQIGTKQSAAQVIAYSARAAALEDRRFDPVRPHELPEIEIELSVLSQPATIAPHEIEVGKHGLIVSRGWQRGLLLPQVAPEHRWESSRFLEETCVKAGLERDAWKDPQTLILAFTAQVFSDSEIQRDADFETPKVLKSDYSSST